MSEKKIKIRPQKTEIIDDSEYVLIPKETITIRPKKGKPIDDSKYKLILMPKKPKSAPKIKKPLKKYQESPRVKEDREERKEYAEEKKIKIKPKAKTGAPAKLLVPKNFGKKKFGTQQEVMEGKAVKTYAGDTQADLKKKFGSRAEVYHGNAMMTTGGLKKNDLIKNKRGVIVSKRKSENAKSNDILSRLEK